MARQIDVDQNKDHVGGNFTWAIQPSCCDLLKSAVDEERFIFVGNMGTKASNNFYMLPVTNEGYLARTDGVGISYCPWCGTKIAGKKLYPNKKT